MKTRCSGWMIWIFIGAILTIVSPALMAQTLTIEDIIPNSMSGETSQSAEPSIAVDPNDPSSVVVSAFGDGSSNPYFGTTDGGLSWTNFATIVHGDTTLDWAAGGSPTVAYSSTDGTKINAGTFSFPGAGTYNDIAAAQFANNTYGVDQPWLVAGSRNNLYIGFLNHPQ